MEIERNSTTMITIKGNIKSIEDGMQIKDSIRQARAEGAAVLELRIVDSFSMTSTVIGNLMKLVYHDKLPVSVTVGDHRLFRLMEELSLVQPLKVRLSKD
jgi:hypothetical protein